MKRIIAAPIIAASLLLCGTLSQAATSTAVEISIGGIGPGVDATAFKKVKLLISDAIYRGTVDYFDVYGYGKEGGFSACAEKGRFAEVGSFERFVKALRAIKPNPSTTAYNVSGVALCTFPTAPEPAAAP
jgi:hypothetical protein